MAYCAPSFTGAKISPYLDQEEGLAGAWAPCQEERDELRLPPREAEGMRLAEQLCWRIEGDYDYSSTQVNIDDDLAGRIISWGEQEISDKDIYTGGDDTKGREDTPHITVLYGILTQSVDEVIDLLADEGPARATLGKVSLFENADDYDVVKISVESKDLARLNKLLSDNLENENKFSEYEPHVTVAYVKQGAGSKYSGSNEFEGREVTFDEIRFSTKDEKETFISLHGSVAADLTWRV